jgi:hypothetical protein
MGIYDVVILLTPKIGTGNRLTCEPNLAEEYHSARGFPQIIRQEVFLKAFGIGLCGREYIVIRQKSCSTDGSKSIRECVMTWIGYKEGDKLMMDTERT